MESHINRSRITYFLLSLYSLEAGRWHRSKDKVAKPESDFGAYMINKKWWLDEQFNVHMMRFQQVRCILITQFDMFHSRLDC